MGLNRSLKPDRFVLVTDDVSLCTVTKKLGGHDEKKEKR
jgi:hypothetical protein